MQELAVVAFGSFQTPAGRFQHVNQIPDLQCSHDTAPRGIPERVLYLSVSLHRGSSTHNAQAVDLTAAPDSCCESLPTTSRHESGGNRPQTAGKWRPLRADRQPLGNNHFTV